MQLSPRAALGWPRVWKAHNIELVHQEVRDVIVIGLGSARPQTKPARLHCRELITGGSTTTR